MKYNFFALSLLATLFSLKINAQKSIFNYGLKAGFNQPFFKTEKNSNTEYTSDDNFIYAGLTTDLRFSKQFSLQTEVYWHRDPVQYYFQGSGTGYIIQEQIEYISIPVLAKLHAGKIAIYAGPQISFLTKAELPHLVNSAGQIYSVDATDSSYKKTRYSATVGLEWAFKYRFGVDVRYMAAMGNIANPNGKTPLTAGSNPLVKISNIQAGLFFRFGKKPKFLADEKKKS